MLSMTSAAVIFCCPEQCCRQKSSSELWRECQIHILQQIYYCRTSKHSVSDLAWSTSSYNWAEKLDEAVGPRGNANISMGGKWQSMGRENNDESQEEYWGGQILFHLLTVSPCFVLDSLNTWWNSLGEVISRKIITFCSISSDWSVDLFHTWSSHWFP